MFGPALDVADAGLFGGSSLYPYLASSTKNQRPFAFGTLLPVGPEPHAGSERSHFSCEAIAVGPRSATVRTLARYLELDEPDGATPRGAVRDVATPPRTLAELIDAPL